MNYIFVTPPGFQANFAPLTGIPEILGYIQNKGDKAQFIDLNLELINKLANKNFLYSIIDKYKTLLSKEASKYKNTPHIQEVLNENSETLKQNLIKIQKASIVLNLHFFLMKNDITFYNPNLCYSSLINIMDTLKLFPVFEKLYLKKFIPDFSDYSSGLLEKDFKLDISLIKEYFNSEFNIYKEYYSENIEKILNLKPDYIGITISTGEQILPALYICYNIKKNSNIHINIGSHFFNAYYENITNLNELFVQFFDSISITSESIPTTDGFIKYFRNEIEFKDIPNIVYYDYENDKVKVNRIKSKYNFSQSPVSSFDGFKRENYLAPELVLPIKTSTNCYWHKCIFCGCSNPENKYYVKPVEKIVEEIEILSKKYNTKFFYFWDNCIHPTYMEKMAKLLIKKKLKIKYSIYARFELSFTKELLKLMKKSGCLVIHWGLDSASQRILDYINKGIKVENAKQVLENSHKAGIYNFVYLLLEQPTTTDEDLEKNVEFINENKKNIDMINAITKLVPLKGSIIAQNYENKYKEELRSISMEKIDDCHNKIVIALWSEGYREFIRFSSINILYLNKYGNKKLAKLLNKSLLIKNRHFFKLYIKTILNIIKIRKHIKFSIFNH